MNKKGLIEGGVILSQIMILVSMAVVAGSRGTDVFFGGGNPAGAGFFTAAHALTAYSQMPHVKRDFREKRAVEMGFTEADAKALSDENLLAAIRDDGHTDFYKVIEHEKSGGGLRARILAAQK